MIDAGAIPGSRPPASTNELVAAATEKAPATTVAAVSRRWKRWSTIGVPCSCGDCSSRAVAVSAAMSCRADSTSAFAEWSAPTVPQKTATMQTADSPASAIRCTQWPLTTTTRVIAAIDHQESSRLTASRTASATGPGCSCTRSRPLQPSQPAHTVSSRAIRRTREVVVRR